MMYAKYDTYSKEEILKSLIEYIKHVADCEGISFLSNRYSYAFEPGIWEILTKADKDADDHDPS